SSTLLIMTASFVWSELFFIFLLSLYFLFLSKFLEKKKVHFLYLATIAGFLMLLQRNSGIFIISFVIAGTLWHSSGPRDLVKRWVPHFLVIVSGSVLWNVKVFFIDNKINIFSELVPTLSLWRNFKAVFYHFGKILIPEIFTRWIPITFYAAVLVWILI